MASPALLAVCTSSLTRLEVTEERQGPRCCLLLTLLSGGGAGEGLDQCATFHTHAGMGKLLAPQASRPSLQ